MLVSAGFFMSLIAGAAATLVYVYNLEEEFNLVASYIVVCLVCLFVLIYAATWK